MGSGEIERASYLSSVYYNTPAAVPGAWLLAPHIKGLFFFFSSSSLVLQGSWLTKIWSPLLSLWEVLVSLEGETLLGCQAEN